MQMKARNPAGIDELTAVASDLLEVLFWYHVKHAREFQEEFPNSDVASLEMVNRKVQDLAPHITKALKMFRPMDQRELKSRVIVVSECYLRAVAESMDAQSQRDMFSCIFPDLQKQEIERFVVPFTKIGVLEGGRDAGISALAREKCGIVFYGGIRSKTVKRILNQKLDGQSAWLFEEMASTMRSKIAFRHERGEWFKNEDDIAAIRLSEIIKIREAALSTAIKKSARKYRRKKLG
jgi:hypothetical protein